MIPMTILVLWVAASTGCSTSDSPTEPTFVAGDYVGGQRQVSYQFSMRWGKDGVLANSIDIGDSTSLRWLDHDVTYMRPVFNGESGPMFAFAHPDIPDCLIPIEKAGGMAPFRIEFGIDPRPWPRSARIESSDQQYKLLGYARNVMWARFDYWSVADSAYTYTSPWFKVTFAGPDPPDPRDHHQE